jgi:hypothetical protein
MTRILAAVVLGASMILTTAAAFAESNSAMDREPVRNLIEQPAPVALDVAVVSGDPGSNYGPFHEQRLDNLDPHAGF